MQPSHEITRMLHELEAGHESAVNSLFPLVYDELRRMARRHMGRERKDHTLSPTALVHEAYLKLVVQDEMSYANRAHFFAIAAQAMRRILINYAQHKKAKKRGGGQTMVTLNEEIQGGREVREDQLLLLDSALTELEQLNARQCKVVEYRFFSGLTHEEVASVLNVSVPTVRRDWRLARAWLTKKLRDA